MTALPNSLQARDIAYHFHPYTNARRHEKIGPMVIDRGSGIYVYDDQGREYIEAMAGLWSVGVGFGEDRLVQAAARQMSRLPYYHTFTTNAASTCPSRSSGMSPARITTASVCLAKPKRPSPTVSPPNSKRSFSKRAPTRSQPSSASR